MAVRAFTMPKWGIEMQQGTLAEWLVAEGDAFEKGQLLALIETDKITNEVEAEAPGVLKKIVTPAGETQPVGALLAIFGDKDDGDDTVAAFAATFKAADTSMAAGRAAAPPAPKPAAVPAAATAAAPAVVIPSDFPISPEARRRAEEAGVDVTAIAGTGRNGRVTLQDVEQAIRPPAPEVAGNPIANAVGTDALDGHYASPLAKRLALLHGIDLSGMAGTGPRGRISKADVLARVAPPSAPAPVPVVQAKIAADNRPEILPMSAIRKTIARRLTESKQTIPHYYLRAEVVVDALLALRPTANLIMGVKASVNDYIVRAAALALIEVPDVNIQVHGDAIHRFPDADIAVAVATERGLVTPVVRSANRLRVGEISEEIKALVGKAQAGKLAMAEIDGGTFTVSNLGMFGVDQFDAIINPPQGAILAVGASRKVRAEGPDGAGRFENRIGLSLSCDHRAIDGAVGARFLQALKAIIEQPERLFA